MNLFEEYNLSNPLMTAINQLGFDNPTQIQQLSIPHIMAGKDVIGESATGSGKTLAFGCSVVDHVISGQGLQALILTPTRELAEQVRMSLTQLSYFKHLRVISVYGGVSISNQINNLTKAEVVVATPGRLLDHIRRRTINTSKIKVLVLDEVDTMFDMGFIEDVKKIIRVCPTNRQTLCFSATISSSIKELANKYMINPIRVSAVKLVDPSKMEQIYYNVRRNVKLSLLIHLLQHEQSKLAMVFCNTRRATDLVVKNLRANKINATAIHGGLSQNKRTSTMKMFNNAKANVLVCTDVASRGLHIDNVSHIYNYDLPKDAKDYVHRIGRTARAGETGKVINLLCDIDHDNFSRILREYNSFRIEKVEAPVMEKVLIVSADNDYEQSRGHNGWRGQQSHHRSTNHWNGPPRRNSFSAQRR